MGIYWNIKRRLRGAWVVVWSLALVLALGCWIFFAFHSWFPLDWRNSARWVVKVRDGAIEVKDFNHVRGRTIAGSFGDRFYRKQVPSGFGYLHDFGIVWPRIHVQVGQVPINTVERFRQFVAGDLASGEISWTAYIPLWVPAAISLICVLPFLTVKRRRRCLGGGYCSQCRYDLTGNESGTCPECGTTLSKTIMVEQAG